jgi:hypothetical protein
MYHLENQGHAETRRYWTRRDTPQVDTPPLPPAHQPSVSSMSYTIKKHATTSKDDNLLMWENMC